MREFEGRVAVVTGAASGMGLAFAERFAAEGMKVVLTDIEEEPLHAAVTRLKQEERDVIGVVTDVASEESIQALHDEAIAKYGKVHILCNNAGVFGGIHVGPIWEATQNDWDWTFGVNAWGVVNGVKIFLPGMLAHGEPAHIVNTSSIGGVVPGSGIYGISKHVVVAYSETLYSQLAGTNVGVSVLCPSAIKTGIADGVRNRQDRYSDPGDTKGEFGGEQMVRPLVEHGAPPSHAADVVFDSIVDEKFWIFTNEMADPMVQQRMEQILTRTNPAVATGDPGELPNL